METIKVKTDFHTAHRQIGYPGKCKHIHGHTWRGAVSLTTERFPRNQLDMAIDFGDLKDIFRQFDHKILVSADDREFIDNPAIDREGIIEIPGANPSVENITYFCLDALKKVIERQYPAKGLAYHVELTVQETENNIFILETDFTI